MKEDVLWKHFSFMFTFGSFHWHSIQINISDLEFLLSIILILTLCPDWLRSPWVLAVTAVGAPWWVWRRCRGRPRPAGTSTTGGRWRWRATVPRRRRTRPRTDNRCCWVFVSELTLSVNVGVNGRFSPHMTLWWTGKLSQHRLHLVTTGIGCSCRRLKNEWMKMTTMLFIIMIIVMFMTTIKAKLL